MKQFSLFVCFFIETESYSLSQEISPLCKSGSLVAVLTRTRHCPCPELDKSRPQSPILFREIRFNIIFPFMSRYSEWSLPFRLSYQFYARISLFPAHLIHLDSIIQTINEALHFLRVTFHNTLAVMGKCR